MASLKKELRGNYRQILRDIEDAVLSRSATASTEGQADFATENARCAVRVYERYSWFGGNRVSMTVTLLESDGRIFLSAITAGGSQAMFFKVNTLGEGAFLETVYDVISRYAV